MPRRQLIILYSTQDFMPSHNEWRRQAEWEEWAKVLCKNRKWCSYTILHCLMMYIPKGGWIKVSWTMLILWFANFCMEGCVILMSFVYIWTDSLRKYNAEPTLQCMCVFSQMCVYLHYTVQCRFRITFS